MNISIEDWDHVVGALYESIARPSDLPGVMKRANALLDSDFCHLLGIGGAGKLVFSHLTASGHESTSEAYARHYAHIDPRRAFMETISPGENYRCSSVFDSAFVDRSEFYQDFLIPNGLRYVLGSCLHRDHHQSVYIAFNHGAGRDDFTDIEAAYFARLLDHIQRTVRGILTNGSFADAIKGGEDRLYEYRHGILGLTVDGKVSFANEEAENTLLTMPTQFVNGRLVDGAALRHVFDNVRHHGKPESCAIEHPTGTLYVTGVPFRGEASADGELDLRIGARTRVLILCGGRQQRSHTVRQLMQWFGFTAAEARLARELAGGGTIEHFARTYSVSVATVRTQLRAVLTKSGTSRQQDLIRLLLTLPLSS